MKDEIYDKMYRVEDRHWWFAAKRRIIRDLLRRYLPAASGKNPRRLADLGCGCGRTLEELPPGFSGIGLDSSQKAIDFCTARGVDALLGSLPDDVPFEEKSFDAVVMADSLEHIENDSAAAIVAAALLRPKGIMLITVPALPLLWSEWDEMHSHKRRYTKRSLAGVLEETGLAIEFISYYNSLLFPVAAADRIWAKATSRKSPAGLSIPPRPINSALKFLFASERHLLGRVPLPIGLSLVAVCRKPT